MQTIGQKTRRRLFGLGVALGLNAMLGVTSAQVALVTEPLKTDQDRLSYALGAVTGEGFRANHIDVDAKFFAYGFYDAFSGNKMAMNRDEIQKTVSDFQDKQQKESVEKMQTVNNENIKTGETFLAENKKKPGVITLKSGLQYKIITAGTGRKPQLNDTVVVDYEGRLIDGKVFDSSYKRGQPASFPLSQVIQGWQEGLSLMPVGSVWELYIPANLAYGDADVPGIGPSQVLIFKIHLLSIEAK
jgi:FKBP-type peptidyl-prolyl cis-trans isomerase FklB